MAGSYLPNQIAQTADYAPGYGCVVDSTPGQLTRDEDGVAKDRSTVLTDEGGFISNFANSSLELSIGTCTFTNGSDVVTGTNFDTYDLHIDDYVFLDSDGIGSSKRVVYFTPTELTLSGNYTGTGGTGASSRQIMKSVVGTGASIAVSNGTCVLTSGTSNGAITELERDVDYFPLRARAALTFSAAPGANSTANFGLYDETIASPKTFAWFEYTGTSTTTVLCKTGWNPLGSVTANETQTTTAQVGGSITDIHLYELYLAFDAVVFTIDDIIVATHKLVIPHMHDELACSLRITNGTGASSYTITANMIACKNFNEVDIATNKVQNVSTQISPDKVFPIWAPNTTAIIFDTQGFSGIRFHIPVAGTASVITPAWSDNGTNFVNGGGFNPVGGGAYVSTITNSTAGMWTMPAQGRWLRLTGASNQTGGVIVTLSNRTSLPVNPTTTVSGTVVINGGAAAHDAAVSGNPVRIAGRGITSNYTPVANNDTTDIALTTVGAQIIKPYAIPELEWAAGDTIENSTTPKQLKVATASNKTYLTGLSLAWDTLGAAIEIQLRDIPIVSSTATISGNTLVMSATYNWKVGDLIYVTASTVTGLTAGSYYYLLTVSTTSLTFSATRGGSTLAISGTSVNATLAHICYRTQLQTASSDRNLVFNTPIQSGTGLGLEMCTPTATSGRIDFTATGYVAP